MIVTIGGIAAHELADTFGTPLYAFDGDRIRQRVRALQSAVPGHRPKLFYSIKAHPSVAILRLLSDLGVGGDACSPGDLAYAARAGLHGDEITYAAVSFPTGDRDALIDTGGFLIADAPAQLTMYAQRTEHRRDVGLRVSPSITAGFHPLVQAGARGSKFGVAPSAVRSVVCKARQLGLRVTCLHVHLGSDVASPMSHVAALELVLKLATVDAPDVSIIDLGGGWPVPFATFDAGNHYPPASPSDSYLLAEMGEQVRTRLDRFRAATGRPIKLRFEPGAYLVMDAGFLITRVTDLKRPETGFDSPRPMAIIDSSYSHLFSAVIHNTFHEALVDGSSGRPLVHQDVGGHLMQAGDILARDRLLPALEVGDVIVFVKAGAYKASQASVFNGRPRPAEVLVDRGVARLVRRRETVADLVRFEAHGDAVPEDSRLGD